MSRRGGFNRRTGVVAAVIILALLAGVYMILRMTPLSAVDNVTIVGVEGPKASAIRAALDEAARGQSTLGFKTGPLHDAVANRASITGIDVHPRFPHGVQIEVQQRTAVAAISAGDRRVAVATDGTLLKDWSAEKLPILNGGRAEGGRLVSTQRDAVTILGAAPEPLLGRVARVDKLTVVRLANGPALLFHDTTRLNAKWAAAVAVLSDAKANGATWIDLRAPERPVAGSGAPPVLPAAGVPVRDRSAAQTASGTASGSTTGTATASSATGVPTDGTAATNGATADSLTNSAPNSSAAAPSTAVGAAPSESAATTSTPEVQP